MSNPSDEPTLAGAPSGTETTVGETGRGSASYARGEAGLSRGDPVGRYTVLRRLGAGGMGVVYAAYDPQLDRQVALKLLHASPVGPTEPGSRSAGQHRLLREAQALARLSHPHVVTVHDVGEVDDRVFVAMEYVEGRTLGAWRDEVDRRWPAIRDLFLDAGRGLAAAHRAGLVHRDFKPDNVMVGDDGRVRVMDFGLARATEDEPATAEAPPGEAGETALSASVTRTGATLGTPAYMSPEQHLGHPADARSDQFSFCVALYEALYGQRPFAGTTLAELAFSVTQGDLADQPPGADVPGWLRDTVLRGLATDPAQRWPDMDALLDALQADARAGRRRTAVFAVVALAAVGAAGVVLGRAGQDTEVCADARAALAGVWDDARRDEVRTAFESSGNALAATALANTVSRLDTQAEAWVRERAAACEATHVEKIQSEALLDLRMACLDRKRNELGALVDVLAAAEGTTIERSVRAAADLSPVEACADLDDLLARVPLPTDPETREAVEAVRQELARAKALEDAGHFAQSREIAEPAVARATELGYRPLQAEAGLRLGWALARSAKYEPARDALTAALRAARAGGDVQAAAEIEAMLTWVVGDAMGKHEDGLAWGRDALADVEHLGEGSLVHAQVLTNQGSILTNLGKAREGAEHHQKALAIYEEAFELDHPRTAAVLNNLGIAQLEAGDTAEAVETHRRALEMRERLGGPGHPDVATSLTNMGNALRNLGKVDEALEAQERALKIREATLGPDHPRVASTVGSLAIVYATVGRLDEALVHFRDCVDRFERAFGPEHAELAGALGNLAQALTLAGELDEAMEVQERALKIRMKVFGPEHPDTANSHSAIGEILYTREKFAEALASYEKALAIREKALPENHPATVSALIRTASARLELGGARKAVDELERANRMLAAKQSDPMQVAEAKFYLADALWRANRDRGRAATLAAEAEKIYAERGPGAKAQREEVQAWRAGHPAP